jgi:hypothetical protein
MIQFTSKPTITAFLSTMLSLFGLQGRAQSQADLLVIAPQEFAPTLAPLVQHKRATGMPTTLITLEWILGRRGFTGVDEPERVKRAIAYYERNYGTKYVMLVGDSDRFPVRYTAKARTYGAAPESITFGNTDLYYADLYKGNPSHRVFDDWNARKDGYHRELIGELHKTGNINFDQIDYLPDVAVGRVPASTTDEVARYVGKIIRYEGRTWAFSLGLVVGIDGALGQGNQTYADVLASRFSRGGIYPFTLYDPKWNLPGLAADPAWISFFLNHAEFYGCQMKFMSMSGHGTPSGWGGFFGRTNVQALSNATNLPVVFSASCDIARFAPKAIMQRYMTVDGRVFSPRLGLLGFDSTPTGLARTTLRVQHPVAAEIVAGDVDGNGRDETICLMPGNPLALIVETNSAPLKRLADVRFADSTNARVASGNFDADAADEVVVVMQDRSDQFTILVYDWQGERLVRVNDVRTRDTAGDVATGDLDGDGRDEILVTCYDTLGRLTVRVYEVRGRNDMVRVHDLRLRGADAHPAMMDVDADGRDEIVLTSIDGSGRVALFVYEALGGWRRTGDVRLAGSSPKVTARDTDGNGREDIVIALQTSSRNFATLTYRMNRPGQLARISDIRLSGTECHVASGNFDDDNQEEIVIVSKDSQGRCAVMIYDGTARPVRIGDVRETLSTPIDLVTGNWDQDPQSEIVVWANRSKGRQRPPAPIQPEFIDVEAESMAEEFLVKNTGGAVAFVGGSTGQQSPCLMLERFFFESYTRFNDRVIGDMWNRALRRFHAHFNLSNSWQNESSCSSTNTCWVRLAKFNTGMKTMLFGDPSLRIKSP